MSLTPEVEEAIEELRQGAPGGRVRFEEDGEGGAFVVADDVEIGECFSPSTSWVGFHITFSYPNADVYPHFIDPEIRYVGDGPAPVGHPDGDLPKAMRRDQKLDGFDLPAIQISRSSKRRDAETDSALHKLLRVIDFLRTR